MTTTDLIMEAGDRIRVTTDGQRIEGVLLPSTTTEHLVIKREGGYNVGVDRNNASVEILESGIHDIGGESLERATSSVEFDPELPTITLVSTGGTIASTVDYRTGAVSPQFDVADVLRAIPDLQGLANFRGRVVSNLLSENMTPAVWIDLAEAIAEEIRSGVDGIVVMHGTDTMQFSASALAFMLETPVPIVFTGSQRSADRPSSDNVMNAVCAVATAKSDIAEVLVCMHESTNDDQCSIHRATRVRKNHTSRRSAFETVGREPLATITYESLIRNIRSGATYRARDDQDLSLSAQLNTNVELVKFAPGASTDLLSIAGDGAGVVIEGTGLGHVSEPWRTEIASLVEDGTTVVMTSQCIEGRVCDRVYETGRDLIEAGVIEAEDTLPETAVVKLMWVLANTEDVVTTMQTSLAGECTRQSRPWH